MNVINLNSDKRIFTISWLGGRTKISWLSRSNDNSR